MPKVRFRGFTDPWEHRKLGELYIKSGSGGTPTANIDAYYGGTIPFLGIADISERFITETRKSITSEGLAASAAWIVPKGSIALAMYASVGKVGIIWKDMATSQAFFNMVFDSDANRDFVFTRLQMAETNNEWDSLISTGTQRNLNAEKVRDWTLLVPNISEREKIGSFFSRLDDLITLHQHELDKLKSVKQAFLQDMFPRAIA